MTSVYGWLFCAHHPSNSLLRADIQAESGNGGRRVHSIIEWNCQPPRLIDGLDGFVWWLRTQKKQKHNRHTADSCYVVARHKNRVNTEIIMHDRHNGLQLVQQDVRSTDQAPTKTNSPATSLAWPWSHFARFDNLWVADKSISWGDSLEAVLFAVSNDL